MHTLFTGDEIITHQTNKYAQSCLTDKRGNGPLLPRSIFATWKEVMVDDTAMALQSLSLFDWVPNVEVKRGPEQMTFEVPHQTYILHALRV